VCPRLLCVPVLSGYLLPGQWVRDHPDLIIIGGAGVVATALAPVLVPLILSGVGFTTAGVAAGSWAAGVHASIGNVAAGSLFALAQSVAAGGLLPIVGWLASAGLGLSAGMITDVVRILYLRVSTGWYREYVVTAAGVAGMLLRNQLAAASGRLKAEGLL
jgi:hypothetical protein